MKATTLLERHHRNIQVLCEAVERGSPSVRESLLPQLANDLAAHLGVEEEIFYPSARKTLDDDPLFYERHDRHGLARAYLEHLMDTPAQDDDFEARICELRRVLDAHFAEEEGSLFRRMDEVLSPAENRALGARMMTLHHARVEAGYHPLPPPQHPPRAYDSQPHR